MNLIRYLPVVVGIAVLTQVESPYILNLACLIAIQALPAIGLSLLLGYTGQISVGHAAFYGLGAYVSALLAVDFGLPPLLTGAVAVAATGVLAYFLGRSILRLRGHYLAMGTLGFGLVVSIVFVEWRSVTGGATGLSGVPPLSLFGLEARGPAESAPLAWTAVLIVLVLVLNLVQSPAGLVMRGLGDSERAVDSVGTDVVRLKAQVFALSAMLAAAGGVLYAHYIGFLSPQPFSVGFSVRLLVMVAIGGFRNIVGVICGVAFTTIIAEPLQDLGYFDVVVFGLILVAIVVLFPDGLLTAGVRWIRRILPTARGAAT